MKLKAIESTISLAKPSKRSIETSKNRAIKTPHLIIDQNHQKYALKPRLKCIKKRRALEDIKNK